MQRIMGFLLGMSLVVLANLTPSLPTAADTPLPACRGKTSEMLALAASHGWHTQEARGATKERLNDRINEVPPVDHERYAHIFMSLLGDGHVVIAVGRDDDCFVGALEFDTDEAFAKWFTGTNA